MRKIVLILLLVSVAATTVQADSIQLRGRIRDFLLSDQHPDFQFGAMATGTVTGCVESLLVGVQRDIIAATPGYADCHITSPTSFATWYDERHNKALRLDYTFNLVDDKNDGVSNYIFDDKTFFPIDSLLGGNEYIPGSNPPEYFPHNYNFTTELRFYFVYNAANTKQKIRAGGEGDFWLFVNNYLMIDLGGIHSGKIEFIDAKDLATLGLQDGQVYPIDIFFAQRSNEPRVSQSHFYLQLQEIEIAPTIPELMIQDARAACYSVGIVDCDAYVIARLTGIWYDKLLTDEPVNWVRLDESLAAFRDQDSTSPLHDLIQQACGHIEMHARVISGAIPLTTAREYCEVGLYDSVGYTLFFEEGGQIGSGGSGTATGNAFIPATLAINRRGLRKTGVRSNNCGTFPFGCDRY